MLSRALCFVFKGASGCKERSTTVRVQPAAQLSFSHQLHTPDAGPEREHGVFHCGTQPRPVSESERVGRGEWHRECDKRDGQWRIRARAPGRRQAGWPALRPRRPSEAGAEQRQLSQRRERERLRQRGERPEPRDDRPHGRRFQPSHRDSVRFRGWWQHKSAAGHGRW